MPAASSAANQSTGRAIAQAGNAVALFALVLVLVNTSHLFTARVPPASPIRASTRTQRVLLVVVDGLRADAVNPALMPRVHALGVYGSLKTSVVGALLPSTVAGLRALIEGKIVPPAEFVNDFRSRHAPEGGLLEVIHTAGGRIFAAGPQLWTDLYGQWIDGNCTVFGLARDDPLVLRATRTACADPQWQLVVVHFCRPDVMAHLHGAKSQEYEASVAWCDQAIDELLQSAGADTLVIVTSDHGVTSAGGHAGTEPAVVRTPLVTSDRSVAAGLEVLPQTDIPHLIASALGLQLSNEKRQASESQLLHTAALCFAAVLAGSWPVLRLLGLAANGAPPKNAAFWLNVSVWLSLPLAWLTPWAAYAATLSILLLAAWSFPGEIHKTVMSAFGSGVLVGAARVGASWLTTINPGFTPAHVFEIGILCLAAMVLGYIVGRATRQASSNGLIWLGVTVATMPPLLMTFLGESVSLSTLDVRLAFRMMETPLGLPGAVLIAALLPFVPLLSMIIGLLRSWQNLERADAKFAPVAAGAGAAIAGELAFAAVVLSFGASQTLSSLALGLLLRECANVTVLFPSLAFAALLLRRNRFSEAAQIQPQIYHQA